MERPIPTTALLDAYALMAALIDHGWVQGYSAFDGDMSVDYRDPHAKAWCVSGATQLAAIEIAEREDCPTRPLGAMLLQQLGDRALAHPSRTIVQWNDYPQRRREDVLDLISDCAHALSNK